MPFPFIYVCDLLDDLERPHLREVPLLQKDLDHYTKKTVIDWFKRHKQRLNESRTDSLAVMSMLMPEKRTDRAYGLSPLDMEHALARIFMLPRDKYAELKRWQTNPIQG